MEITIIKNEDLNKNEYVLFLPSHYRESIRCNDKYFPKILKEELSKAGVPEANLNNQFDAIKFVNNKMYQEFIENSKEVARKSGLLYLGFSNSHLVLVQSIELLEKIKEILNKNFNGVIKRIVITKDLEEVIVAPLNDENLEKYKPDLRPNDECFEDHCSEYIIE